MAESVYKIVELVETSTESWEKAASAAVKRASGSLRDLRIAEVEKLDLVIEKGKVTAARSSTEQDSYSLFPHLNDTFTLARKARSKLRGKRSAAWLCLCGWLILYPAAAAAPGASTFELEHGAITYTVVHKLHEVKGTTHALEGRAQLLPSGELRVQVRTRLKTFDSGNSNRDEHMREATHEPEHPFS